VSTRSKFNGIDKVLICVVYVLTFIGLLGISSATRLNTGEYVEVLKHLVFVVLGTFVMFGTVLVNFTSIDESLRSIIAVALYIGTILFLGLKF